MKWPLKEQPMCLNCYPMKCSLLLLSLTFVSTAFSQNGKNTLFPSDVNNSTSQHVQKVDSIISSFYQLSDTLINQQQKVIERMEASYFCLGQLMDSLTSFKQSRLKSENAIDSLNNIRKLIIGEFDEKLRQLKECTVDRLTKLDVPPEAKNTISILTNGIERFGIPTTNLGVLDGTLSDNTLVNLKGVGMDSDLSQFATVDELRNTNSEISELSDITEKVNGYTSDLRELTSGDVNAIEGLSASAETKAVELSGITDIKKQAEHLTEYQESLGQFRNSTLR